MAVTLKKLADQTGFSQTYICMQLNGQRKATENLKQALKKLAKDEPKRLRDRADRLEQLITGV